MNKQELENSIRELKKEHGTLLKEKKKVRDIKKIQNVRDNLNSSKEKVKKLYRGSKV